MVRRVSLVLATFCWTLLALPAPGRAQTPPTGISGTVTNGSVAATSTGVAAGAPLPFSNVNVYNSQNNFMGGTQTDASGNYAFVSLSPGNYFLVTSNRHGLVDQTWKSPENVSCGGCSPKDNGTAISVTSGAMQTGKNFALPAGPRISGTITDLATNAPLANVNVNFFRTSGGFNSASFATTAADGTFLSAGAFPPGFTFAATTNNQQGYVDRIYNNITCVGGFCNFASGTGITFATSTSADVVANFTLEKGARISGKLTNRIGDAGLTSGSVQFFNSSGVTVGSTGPKDATGAYDSPGLPAGTYYVKAQTFGTPSFISQVFDNIACSNCNPTSGTPIVLTVGETRTLVDFKMDAAGAISARIVDAAGIPIPTNGFNTSSLQVYTTGGTFVQASGSYTASSGVFTAGGLGTGNYIVRASGPNNPNSFSSSYIPKVYVDGGASYECVNCDVTGGTPISVTQPNTTTISGDIALRVGGTITGTVRSTASGNPTISNVQVTVLSPTGSFVASSNTNTSGVYTIGGLLTGTYYVRTNSSSTLNFIPEIWFSTDPTVHVTCVSCSVSAGTGISVTAGQPPQTADFNLQAGASIAGKVTNATGAGIQGFSTVQVTNSLGQSVTSAPTTTSGDFTVAGLPAGTYFLRTNAGNGLMDEVFDDVVCVGCSVTTSGTPIILATGEAKTGVNFALATGGRIGGKITDPTNAPLASSNSGFVGVNVYSASGFQVTSASTGPDGSFLTSTGLPAGRYYVASANGLGYINTLWDNISCFNCPASSGTPIDVVAGATSGGINLVLKTGGRISGTLKTSTGSPIPNAFVNVHSSSGQQLGSTPTNALGAYSLAGLPSDSYFVRTNNGVGFIDQLWGGGPCLGCDVTTGTPIPVAVGNTVGPIDFTLSSGGAISGTVTDTASPTPNPLGGVSIQIYNSFGAFVTGVNTQANGTYVVKGLVPANYFVRTTNSLGFINLLKGSPDIICGNCSITTGLPIAVTGTGTIGNVNFALNPGGILKGRVTTTDATPAGIGGVSVSVLTSTGFFVASNSTDVNGNYTIAGIVPGTGYLLKTFNSQGYIDQVFNGLECVNCTATTGTPVTIAQGTNTPVTFALAPGARIRGRVTDASGNPIAGVFAQVHRANGSFIGSTSTGADGRYVSGTGLPAGDYLLKTSNTLGFVDKLYDNIACLGCPVTGGKAVTLVAGATAAGIDFTLLSGGAISGTATALDGTPLQGVFVQISTDAGTFVTSTSTNGIGKYIVRGLPTGSYVARSSNALGYIDQLYDGSTCVSCSVSGGKRIGVTVGSTTSGINFSLTPGGRVTGTVTAAEGGAPISGVSVQIYTTTGVFMTSGFSSPSGTYITGGLPTGNYVARTFNSVGFINVLKVSPTDIVCNSCSVTGGTPFAVAVGSSTPVNFSLATGGSISGTVKDSASTPAPLANVNVSVSTSSGSFVNSINTAADGTFKVRGLPTGSYVVKTFNSLGFTDKQYDNQVCVSCNPTAGTPVAVTAGSDKPGINFNLAPGGLISGTITDTTSAPLAGINVQFYNSSNFFVTSTTTDNLGKYTTRSGLPAGTYFARTGNSIGYINVIYPTSTCQNCSPTIGSPIPVAVGQTTPNINFALAQGGRITGTVTDAASGLPIGNIGVSVFLSDGTSVGGTNTNASGGYSTSGLPTGTYFVRTNNFLGYVNRLYDAVNCMRCSVARGTPISVTTGATTGNINFALSLGGRVSGTITDAATGAPLPGATVQLFDTGGFSVTGATADATGQYTTFNGLVPGTYYARTFNQIGYINKVYDTFVCVGGTTAGGCFPTNGKPFVVTSGATLTGIDFALNAGGRIAGTITSGGAPVSGAFASVFSSGGTRLTRAFAGSGGQYITPDGLPAGSYYVVTENQSGLIDQLYNGNNVDPTRPILQCGFSCAVTTGKPVEVAAASTTTGITFDLTPGGRISGQVTDKVSGAPIANTDVNVYNAAGAAMAYGRTDGLGNYTTFGGVPTGIYFVQTFSFNSTNQRVNKLYNDITCPACDPTTGTSVAVTTGVTTIGINFALDTGEVIGGTITDAATGLPISGAGVLLFDDQGRFVSSTRSDDSGGYVMSTGVPAGTYFARSNSFDYVNKLYDTGVCLACDVTRGTPITVDGIGSTGGINFALTAGGHIGGTVTATTGGSAVPGSRIRLFNSSGSFIAQTFTNGVGAYITAALPPGNYFVRTANLAGFVDELYNNAPCVPCTQSQGTAVTVVTAGLKTGIDFALDSGGLVSGFVKDQATGSPIKGVTVSVYRASDGVLVATTDPTDANGYYRISLPVGTYQVEPSAVAGFRPALAALRGPFARSTVTVETGTETTGVGFALLACAPLTVNPATLPLGAQGQLYSSTLTATGGTAPFTFSISDGNPNTGLALAASGLLAGTPVFAGTGNFTVAAIDVNQCAGTRTFALTACSFFLSATSRSTTASAGTGTVDLNASALDCPWAIVTTDAWISVTSAPNGTGTATVTFAYGFNASGAARTGTIRIGGQIFTVTQAASTSAAAFGQVDTPLPGTTGVVGSLAVTGWALDDVEVKRVKISRDPVAGEGLTGDVYLGDATLVEGARPDVAVVHPTLPFKTRAGWGYLLLSNMLPNQGNGTFTLHMDAVDAEGAVTRLGSRTFVGDNANSVRPFGAIDTPGQGATISGTSFVNFGWALTPNPKRIPTNGSTVTVYIDSVPAGNPTYNNFRGDVAGLFPGLANTGGAIGFKYFDTTTWVNGVHTISWVVFDDAGQAEGIGSRYFTVNNLLASQRFTPTLAGLRASAATGAASSGPAVSARVGFDRTQPALEVPPDGLGGRLVAVGQLNRLELRFGQAGCGPVSAVQIANGEHVPLPVGATLDPSGAFFWMPGPAFLGTYDVEFSVPSCAGGETKIPVAIAVVPGR